MEEGLVNDVIRVGRTHLREVSEFLGLLVDPCFLHHLLHHLHQLHHLPATTGPPEITHTLWFPLNFLQNILLLVNPNVQP